MIQLSSARIRENRTGACMREAYTDRKNVTDFLYLVLHLACKVTCYFQLFSSVLVSVLRTSINVLSKSKSRNYVTWIANLTKLFLSVYPPSFCLFLNVSSMKIKTEARNQKIGRQFSLLSGGCLVVVRRFSDICRLVVLLLSFSCQVIVG